jgi:hypothetical protein
MVTLTRIIMATKCYRFVTVLYFFYDFLMYGKAENQKAGALLGRKIYYCNALVLYPVLIGRFNW